MFVVGVLHYVLRFSRVFYWRIATMTGRRCLMPICINLTHLRGFELRHVRLISCFKTSQIIAGCSDTVVTLSRRFNSDDVKNPHRRLGQFNSETESAKQQTSSVEPGEKVSYDRNFITALRAMQDFLLKPGTK